MDVQGRWIVASVVVLLAGGGGIFACLRKRDFHAAQYVSLGVLTYTFIVLLLWGTTSTYFFKSQIEIPATLKRLVLAGAGGLLAQIVVWLNRVTRGKDKTHEIGPIYADAFIGIVSGMVAAAILATTKDSFTAINDQQAAVAGVAGGALGLSLFDAVKKFVPGLGLAKDAGDEAAASDTAPKRGTCLYAGQTYSHGATLSMPAPRGTVVKTCDGRTGGWKIEDA